MQPMNFSRILQCPSKTFFLFGPRGTGKSTWLRDHFQPDLTVDLLRSAEFLKLSADPGLLRSRVEALPPGSKIVIDEIQKLPILLDEVHSLIFDYRDNYQFALTGSSARKLKQADANMLAGRAFKREMFPLCARELGDAFDIKEALHFGTLPGILNIRDPAEKCDFLYA